MDRKRTEPCSAGDILESILGRTLGSAESQPSSPKTKPKGDFLEMEETTADEGREGHYDLDLAEYPLFQFHTKRVGKAGSQLLRYQDTIKGPNGQPVRREWVVHSGPLGYGGPSARPSSTTSCNSTSSKGPRAARSNSAPCVPSFFATANATPPPAITTAYAATWIFSGDMTSTARTPSGTGNAGPTSA